MSDRRPIINITRGTVVCEEAVLADRRLQRMRGLRGRGPLRGGEGLLLQPAPSVHTAFIRFPIDAVFLDRESNVVSVVEALAPWRAASAPRARSVLELAAGEGARRGVTVGDWLIRVSEDLSWADADADEKSTATPDAGRDPMHAVPEETKVVDRPAAPNASRGMPNLLLVSRDRRFRGVMAVLLSARGFSVTPSAHFPDQVTAVTTAPDVVLIDAGNSLVSAEAAAARAGLVTPDRTVVFVIDSGQAGTTAAVFRKWGSLERLCDEIASARPSAIGRPRSRERAVD